MKAVGQFRVRDGSLSRMLFAWLAIFATCAVAQESEGPVFTPEEQAWMAAHPVIRVGFDPHWEPFSSVDGAGRLQGHDIDLLRALEKRLPLRFELVTGDHWHEIYERGVRREVDMLFSTARYPEREAHFLFTNPYFDAPIGIVTRKEMPFFATGVKAFADKKLVMPRDYVVTRELQLTEPDIEMVLVNTMHEALLSVSQNEAHATLTVLPNATRLVASKGLTNLKIAGVTPMSFGLRMAVRKDWPILVSILNKTLDSIPLHERQRMLDRWVNADYESLITWEKTGLYFAMILTGGAAVLILLLVWNFTLRRSYVRQHEAARELARTRDELARLNEEQRRMLGIIAHDLKNPLTAMTLSADLLRIPSYHQPESIHRISEDLGHMASRMHHLVEQVLEFQQLNEGRRYFKLEPTDLRTPLLDSLRLVKPSAELKDITVTSDLPESAIICSVEHLAFSQIVENLVSNAVKFTPSGGKVEVSLRKADTCARLEVRDNGPGIQEEDRKELFKRFAKLSNLPTAGETSSGLGLAIVYELTQHLGGRVWCESEPGKGATFIVELPLFEAKEEMAFPQPAPACA